MKTRTAFALLLALPALCFPPLRADQVECENGDKYNGKVLSMDSATLRFESEVTGRISIPRSKVVLISFRPSVEGSPLKAPTLPPSLVPPAAGAAKPGPAPGGFDPKAIEQVQKEFLGAATPEANAMFSDMLKGLATGTLSIGDIRGQAAQSLKELEALQKEIGEEEENPLLGSYVGILKNFLRQTEKEGPAKTPSPARPPETAPKAADE